MRISEMCTRSVVTCGRAASALEIARQMHERHVGDVIVVDGQAGKLTPVGVVTDRDLVVEVMAKGIDPSRLYAGDLIAGTLETACESELIHDAVWHLRSKRIRRLPVVDSCGHLVGVLTADDVARFLAEELNELMHIAPGQVAREHDRRVAAGAGAKGMT